MAPMGGARSAIVSSGGPAIPDSDIFQDPIYRFGFWEVEESDGTSPFDVPELLADLSDASAVGSPTFREDQNGVSAGEYDGSNDGHDFSPDGDLPTGDSPVSIAALCYIRNTSSNNHIAGFGDADPDEWFRMVVTDKVEIRIFGGDNAAGGSVPENEWITIGGSYDGSGNVRSFLNGSEVATSSISSQSFTNNSCSIGYNASRDEWYTDGFIGDVIFSSTNESESSFSDYHDHWMSMVE